MKTKTKTTAPVLADGAVVKTSALEIAPPEHITKLHDEWLAANDCYHAARLARRQDKAPDAEVRAAEQSSYAAYRRYAQAKIRREQLLSLLASGTLLCAFAGDHSHPFALSEIASETIVNPDSALYCRACWAGQCERTAA